jgi:hypothetical protein
MPPVERRRRRQTLSGFALLLMLASAAQASEDAAANAPELDAAFLLFLSDWDDGKGNWQDPLDYEDPQWRELDAPKVTDHATSDHP